MSSGLIKLLCLFGGIKGMEHQPLYLRESIQRELPQEHEAFGYDQDGCQNVEMASGPARPRLTLTFPPFLQLEASSPSSRSRRVSDAASSAGTIAGR